jgi:manganese-dependent inorganic pyrophosphatase
MEPIIVTSYNSPDLDGFAGAIAYAEFLNRTGEQAVAYFFDKPRGEEAYIMRTFAIPYPPTGNPGYRFDRVTLVDASTRVGLNEAIRDESVIEVIDHRAANDKVLFTNARIQIEPVGAAATLVTERFMEEHLAPTPPTAVLLSGAIISNTLNFKSRTTTDRDHQAFAWLGRFVNLPDGFVTRLFEEKSDLHGGRLAERMKSETAWLIINGEKIGIVQLEVVGGEKLARDREHDIAKILGEIRSALRLDRIMLTIVILEGDGNIFICEDPILRSMLEQCTGVRFDGALARKDGLMMRKELIPRLTGRAR